MNLLFAIVKTSLRTLWVNKMRTCLTVLGISIGVSSVIAMMALGSGTKEAMVQNMRDFGSDILILHPERRKSAGRTSTNMEALTIEDCEAILARVPEIKAASPEVNKPVVAKYGNRNINTSAKGVSIPYLDMKNYEIAEGRNFSTGEEQHQRKVAVLGYKIVDELFDGEAAAAIGEEIRLDGTAYRIIGTMIERGDSGWFNPDDLVLIPYTTAMRRVVGTTNLYMVNLQMINEDPKTVAAAQMGIRRVMRKRHELTEDMGDDFDIGVPSDFLKSMEQIGQTFTVLIAGIASISLLVGGIGIMNIMLVTVTERTREIGIRKALGAKRRDIMMQFLIESVIISLIGGIMGVLFGYGMAQLASVRLTTAEVPISAVVLSLGFCFFIGVFFGIYPARKASRLNPIDALRHE